VWAAATPMMMRQAAADEAGKALNRANAMPIIESDH
jgi:hypothetical protein